MSHETKQVPIPPTTNQTNLLLVGECLIELGSYCHKPHPVPFQEGGMGLLILNQHFYQAQRPSNNTVGLVNGAGHGFMERTTAL